MWTVGALSFAKSMWKVKGDNGESSAGLASYVCRAVTGLENGVESTPRIVTAAESSIPSVSICIRPSAKVNISPGHIEPGKHGVSQDTERKCIMRSN